MRVRSAGEVNLSLTNTCLTCIRFEVDVYLTFFAVSTLLLIAGAALEEPHDSNSRRALWAVSVLTELPMYFVAEKLAKTKATNVLFGSKDDRDILEAVVPVECESRNQKKPNVSEAVLAVLYCTSTSETCPGFHN